MAVLPRTEGDAALLTSAVRREVNQLDAELPLFSVEPRGRRGSGLPLDGPHSFQISPTDPMTLSVVTILLMAPGLTACWMPARRATRLNPVEVPRHE